MKSMPDREFSCFRCEYLDTIELPDGKGEKTYRCQKTKTMFKGYFDGYCEKFKKRAMSSKEFNDVGYSDRPVGQWEEFPYDLLCISYKNGVVVTTLEMIRDNIEWFGGITPKQKKVKK